MRKAADTEPPIVGPGAARIHDDLLDRVVLAGEAAAAEWWVPGGPVVVLGRSNRIESEIHAPRCRAEGVPVFRRLGGGGAVLLDPGTVCVTAAWRTDGPLIRPAEAFQRITAAALAALGLIGVAGAARAGISDIVIGDRKLSGSSLYCGKAGVLYQATVLVRPDVERMERLLRHPTREPDYRRGRSHRDFLTWTEREGWDLTPERIGGALASALVAVPIGQKAEAAEAAA